LRRNTRLRFPEGTSGHRDIFDVRAGTLGHRYRYIDGLAGDNRDVAANETITDDRNQECLGSCRDLEDLETPLDVGERLLSGGLHFDEHGGKPRGRARFHDGTRHTARPWLRLRVHREGQQQRKTKGNCH
jgi:hypothetical protein